MSDHRLLVLGLGNPILTDDAIGLRLADDLLMRIGPDAAIDVDAAHGVSGFDLLERLVARERVIFLDALDTWDVTPGYWCNLTLAGLRHTRYATHLHDLNLPTVLDLGRRLGLKLPLDTDVHLFGVAVAERSTFGTELSAPLAAAYPRLLDEIEHEIRLMAGALRGPTRSSTI